VTKEERAKALALARCRMLPGSGEKRFVRSMVYLAVDEPDTVLTPPQKWYLDTVVYRFRRQLAGRDDDFAIPAAAPDRADYLAAAEERRARRNRGRPVQGNLL